MEISVILFINFKFSQDCTAQQIGFIPNILPVRSPRGPCAGSMPTISTLFIGCQSLAPGPRNRNRNVPRLLKTNQVALQTKRKQALLESLDQHDHNLLSHIPHLYISNWPTTVLVVCRMNGVMIVFTEHQVRCKLGVVRVLDFENKYWLLCSIDWFLAWLHCHCFDLLPSQQSRLPATVLCPQIYP